MFSRREVRWGETRDQDNQGCNTYGENEASQYTRDEIMFPEIMECAKGVEILEGVQGGVNVGEARHQVVGARSSFGNVESLGSKKPEEPNQSMQGQRGLTLPSHLEASGVLLKRQIVCHRCGQSSHIRSQCQRAQRSCFTCGEFDHFARNCPQKKRMQEELGLVQQPGIRQIVIQPQPQNAQRLPIASVSASPGNVKSQGRKRQRESSQLSQNQIRFGLPTLFGNQRVSQLDKHCYICRKPGHFARNCPRGSGVHGKSSSKQPYKRTPNRQQMQLRS